MEFNYLGGVQFGFFVTDAELPMSVLPPTSHGVCTERTGGVF